MPKNKDAYTRYRIIDETLRNKQISYPDLDELKERCEQILGRRISSSSVQKDLYAMRYDEGLGFEAPIEYHKQHKGYYYSDPAYTISKVPLKQDDLYALEFAAGMLRQFNHFPILEQFDATIGRLLEAVKISRHLYGEEVADIIQVESAVSNSGAQLLEFFIQCILDRKEVTFEYYNYSKGKSNSYRVHPYLVREYRNRWYVTGFAPQRDRILTFGLERVTKQVRTGNSFIIRENFNAKKFFQHSFGITVNNLKPVVIELSFTAQEGRYIKSQPLHHTQTIIKENSKELRIRIHVIPSHELMMQILGYGENVKVLKPISLQDEIKASLQKALKRYTK